MPTDYDNNLLKEGILCFKARQFDSARRYFERALDMADDYETRAGAYFYLSELTDDPAQKRKYLEETLAIDMSNAAARRSLAILDGKLKPEEIVDPDTMPAQTTGVVAASADRFTCPKCGGRMAYAPDGVALVCEYCQRTQSLAGGKLADEQDFFVAMASGKGHRKPVAMQTFKCQGCGAEFILGARELSATCAYCGSEHVLRQNRELAAPDSILPLGFDQREATRRLVAWVEKHKIEPQGKVQVPRALYLPVWTFDIAGNIPWNGQVYKNKQLVPVSGMEVMNFNDISIPASHKLSGLLEKVLPEFNFSVVAPYDARFLAGWPAEVYETAMSDASLEARRLVVEQVRRTIHSMHGFVQGLSYTSTAIAVDSFKLVLVPLWFTEYVSGGATYRVVINGVTGAVHGETPSHGLLDWLGELFEG
jgi:predicted RNA-binding Zn-ribbon protein involved in translation (DUF1610 family)